MSALHQVLIVEDHPDAARSLALTLAAADCETEIVGHAADVTPERLAWADVTCVDLDLPDSGPDATIRLIPVWQQSCGVVVVTGYGDEPGRIRALAALGVALVGKPPRGGDLATAVRAAGRTWSLQRALVDLHDRLHALVAGLAP